jgi:hypothetical protein
MEVYMYFDSIGPGNTGETMRIAVEEAKKRGISHIIAASNTGKTAEALAGEAEKQGYGGQLVCVSHVNGFVEPGVNELSPESRKELEKKGMLVCTASHVLSGAERAISGQFRGAYPVEIIAYSLRMFGQGTKVCVEIAVMALDGGFVPFGKPVIAIGGSNGGADTAIVLSPAHANGIFGTRIHEILCKPRLG